MFSFRIKNIFQIHRDDRERLRNLLDGFHRADGKTDLQEEDIESYQTEGLFPSLLNLRIFDYAGIERAKRSKLLMQGATIVFAALIGAILFRSALPLLISTLIVSGMVIFVYRLKYQRAENFEKDYTALLLSLASSVRTGRDPLDALCECRHLFDSKSLVHTELTALYEKLEKGEREQTAVLQFAKDIDHPDINLFRTAFLLSRREGSSLAQCLARLAKVTRQRQSFRRKIRASVAMQRLSALGIAVCSVLIGAIQVLSNADALHKTLAHPLGSKCLTAGVSLLALGLVWMFLLARRKI